MNEKLFTLESVGELVQELSVRSARLAALSAAAKEVAEAHTNSNACRCDNCVGEGRPDMCDTWIKLLDACASLAALVAQKGGE